MDSTERELAVHRAKFAEQAERYEDMREAIKSVVESGEQLTPEERNLLSVAYKNICGSQRSAWRIVSSLISNAESNSNEMQLKVAKEMRDKIVGELNDICNEVIGLIEKCLKNCSESDVEHKTFFCKMRGDYYRYLVEVTPPDSETRSELAQKAKKGYEDACESAEDLPKTNPLRLGLALNYSVFYYEIEGDPKKACELAKKSFDNAIAELDTLKEDSYKDSTLIMQLLRDNLTLWQAEDEGDGEANE